MKKIYLLIAVVCMFAFTANAQPVVCDGWVVENGEALTGTFEPGIIRTVFTGESSNDIWKAQLITPCWKKIGKEGDSFKLSFDVMYEGSGANPRFRIASGKTFPWNPDFHQGSGEFNTQIVDQDGNAVIWDYDFALTAGEWVSYSYDHFIGALGADSIRLEIDHGCEPGTYSFRNFVLEVAGEVVAKYFSPKYSLIDGIMYASYEEALVVGYDLTEDLSSVTIPSTIDVDGKVLNVVEIANNAFRGCTDLTSIVIPNSVTKIGTGAFSGCTSLTFVSIPNSVTNIGYEALNGVRYVAYSGSAPGKPWGAGLAVYMMDEYGFLYYDAEKTQLCMYIGNAQSVTIPNSVTWIGEGAFWGCSGLTSVTIPNSVTSIDSYAFEGCSGLTSVTIPNSVTRIGSNAFEGCSGLTSVTIPNSVTSIGYRAFWGCSGLTSVTIGESVSTIDSYAFAGCTSLESIICKSLIPPKCTNNDLLTDNIVNDANLYMNATLTCPENAKLYRTLQPWCNFDFAADANVEHQMDTIYFAVDTLYVINQDVAGGQNKKLYGIKATTADAKMGMAIGSGKYEKDEDAEIVAIEKYGYHFTRWSDGNTSNPRVVNVTADSTFKAEFEVNNYNVLAEANEKQMGRVEGANTYAYLSRTQLKAVPNDGYKFTAWSDGETANPRNILVYSDTTFTAVFVATEVTSVAETAANATNIYAYGNTIIVENATEEICVYDAMGRLICRDATPCVRNEKNVNAAGVYIVKVGNVAKRVMVN